MSGYVKKWPRRVPLCVAGVLIAAVASVLLIPSAWMCPTSNAATFGCIHGVGLIAAIASTLAMLVCAYAIYVRDEQEDDVIGLRWQEAAKDSLALAGRKRVAGRVQLAVLYYESEVANFLAGKRRQIILLLGVGLLMLSAVGAYLVLKRSFPTVWIWAALILGLSGSVMLLSWRRLSHRLPHLGKTLEDLRSAIQAYSVNDQRAFRDGAQPDQDTS